MGGAEGDGRGTSSAATSPPATSPTAFVVSEFERCVQSEPTIAIAVAAMQALTAVVKRSQGTPAAHSSAAPSQRLQPSLPPCCASTLLLTRCVAAPPLLLVCCAASTMMGLEKELKEAIELLKAKVR